MINVGGVIRSYIYNDCYKLTKCWGLLQFYVLLPVVLTLVATQPKDSEAMNIIADLCYIQSGLCKNLLLEMLKSKAIKWFLHLGLHVLWSMGDY